LTRPPFSPPIKPMKARVRGTPPEPPGWVYEPKWDGFRAVAWGGSDSRLDSRNGKPLLRYFPELQPALQQLPSGTVVDGEVVVVIDDVTDFDTLQLRIHPAASRVAMLAEETPADLVAFDLLADRGEDLREVSYGERRRRLEVLFADVQLPWHLTPVTGDLDEATRWFSEYEAAGCDGIICKQSDGVYREDKREWIKWKHRRDADCVVGGYRVHIDGDKIGSILAEIRIMTAALSVGLARAAYGAALGYARERHAFGKPIGEHQAIAFKLADMLTSLHAAALVTYQAAARLDAGRPIGREAAMAKLFASETAVRITDEAARVFASYGLAMEYPVQRYFRDARFLLPGGGTSEILRLVIGRELDWDRGAAFA